MKRAARITMLTVIGLLMLSLAAPAVATESSSESDTTTTVAPELISVGDEPAVVAPPTEVEPVEQPWTVRYLYPLFGVLAVLIIGGFAIGYQRSIRRRYTVVD